MTGRASADVPNVPELVEVHLNPGERTTRSLHTAYWLSLALRFLVGENDSFFKCMVGGRFFGERTQCLPPNLKLHIRVSPPLDELSSVPPPNVDRKGVGSAGYC